MTPRTKARARLTMGRPKKSDAERRRKYGFSMAKETVQAIEKAAKADRRTVSAMAEILILEALAARGIGGKK